MCTELNRQGLLDDETYRMDCEFGWHLPDEVIVGYHTWAIPLANWMRRNRVVTWLAKPIALRWTQEMRHVVAGDRESTFVGRLFS